MESIMNEYFIKNINIKNVRNIENLEILLSDEKRKHLIITGKNGSGKTSTLLAINNLLNKLLSNQFTQIEQMKKNILQYTAHIKRSEQNILSYKKQLELQETTKKKLIQESATPQQIQQVEHSLRSYNSNILNENNNIEKYKQSIEQWNRQITDFSSVELYFSNESEIYGNIINGNFLLAFFEAKRRTQTATPQTVTKQVFQVKYPTTPSLSQTLIQYMVNIKTEKMYAQDEGDVKAVKKIDIWFNRFEQALKELFGEEDLKLVFYRKEFNFKIEYGTTSFGFNELSDGYSSILSIITELILRMEAKNISAYDMQGIVLIDEIETHLHVDLQKKILPFLVKFFPKIQFIVTTHSPFVLSSLSNTVICDLEKRLITSNLSVYSYDALIESYFDSDKYSEVIKKKIEYFEKLSSKSEKNTSEIEEYNKLKRFFKKLPTYMADELAVKINEILLNDLGKNI